MAAGLLLTPVVAMADDWSVPALLEQLSEDPPDVLEFEEVRDVELMQTRVRAEGTIRFEPPDTVIRSLGSPYQQRIVIQGERVTVEERGEVKHELHRDDDAGLGAMSRLMGALYGQVDAAELEAYFDMRLEGDREDWRWILKPTAGEARRRVERMTLEGEGARVERTTLREGDGDHTVTRFSRPSDNGDE